MGLISAISAAAGTALADSWRDYFYCESISRDVLLTKGIKQVGGKSSNKKGSDNIISNGSIIAVADGQCMLIVDQGKVVEVCAEPGEFVWDASSEPSIFYGNLGENILNTFKQIGKRFTFGGDVAKDQRVYYVNTKEIPGNKYGTANPVPFRIVDNRLGLDLDATVRCHGEYSIKVADPVIFYTRVAGNVSSEYRFSEIESQMKSELLSALQPAFATVGGQGVRYSEIPGHTKEVRDALNDELSKDWMELRGIVIVSFGIASITAPEDIEKKIQELQSNAVLMNPAMQAATLTAAKADAMKGAANNSSAGPMMAFAGMNMANMAVGNDISALNAQAAAMQASPASPAAAGVAVAQGAAAGWTCECGATGNTGKFCSECGKPQPAPAAGWTCSCGTVNKGRFCSNCGSAKPAGELQYKCDKCGWEPEDPKNPPKFCPECGDPFGDEDIVR